MVSTSGVLPSVRLAPVPGALRHTDQRAGYSGIGLRGRHCRCFGREVVEPARQAIYGRRS